MSNYNKPNVIPAWAESAANPADIVTPDNAFIAAGWPLSGIPPSRQKFNWLINWCFNGIRYFMQRGLPDWDATETYRGNSRIIGDDGWTYRSLIDNNINHTPSTSPSQWEKWGYTLDQLNGSQLTQATPAGGDNSIKVANTQFVQGAVAALGAALTTAINAVIAALTAETARAEAAEAGAAKILLSGQVTIPSQNYGHSAQALFTFGLAEAVPESSVVCHSVDSDLGVDFSYFAWANGATLFVRVLNSSYVFAHTNNAVNLNYRILQ